MTKKRMRFGPVGAVWLGLFAFLTLSLSLEGCSATHGTGGAAGSAAAQPVSPQQNATSQSAAMVSSTTSTAPDPQAGSTGVANNTSSQYYVDPHTYLIRPVDTSSKEKIVLLTFDDGPKGASTRQILDTLDKYDAKAMWFISGYNYGPAYRPDPNKATQFEALVKEIHSRGHIVGNHTWQHDNLSKLSLDIQGKEITELNSLLKSITGETPRYIRPPFGVSTNFLDAESKALGMQWLNWSVGSLDWVYTDPLQVVHEVVSHVYNGATILMHDNPVEAQALGDILKQLSAEGYHFVLPTEVRPN